MRKLSRRDALAAAGAAAVAATVPAIPAGAGDADAKLLELSRQWWTLYDEYERTRPPEDAADAAVIAWENWGDTNATTRMEIEDRMVGIEARTFEGARAKLAIAEYWWNLEPSSDSNDLLLYGSARDFARLAGRRA